MSMLKSLINILFGSNGSNAETIRFFAVRTTSLNELELMLRNGGAKHRH